MCLIILNRTESEQLVNHQNQLRLTSESLEYKCWYWHLYNFAWHIQKAYTVIDLKESFTCHRVQWYKEPHFIDPLERLTCIGNNMTSSSTSMCRITISHARKVWFTALFIYLSCILMNNGPCSFHTVYIFPPFTLIIHGLHCIFHSKCDLFLKESDMCIW